MSRKAYSEEERNKLRQELVSITLKSIIERGVIHSSINYLCKELGISKTFFYSFYPSKEELILDAMRYQQPKLISYAENLMLDKNKTCIEALELFLRSCCQGSKSGIAVLSIEEEQEVYKCLSEENFKAFQKDQLVFYKKIMEIFTIPIDKFNPKLFGNMVLAMVMTYKAIPDSMPFLFADTADEMVEFQLQAILQSVIRAKQ